MFPEIARVFATLPLTSLKYTRRACYNCKLLVYYQHNAILIVHPSTSHWTTEKQQQNYIYNKTQIYINQ